MVRNLGAPHVPDPVLHLEVVQLLLGFVQADALVVHLDLLARLVVVVKDHLGGPADQRLPDLDRGYPAHIDVAHDVVLHVHGEQGLGNDPVPVVLGSGRRDSQLFEGHQVVHDRDVVGGEVPDHVHVLLEEAEVHARGVVVDELPKLALVDKFLDLPDRTRVNEGVIHVKNLLFLFSQLDQFLSLLHLLGHGLFEPNVLPILQALLSKLEMGRNRGGNSDRVQ